MIKQISLWDRVRKTVGFGMDLQTLAERDEIVVIVGFFDLMGFTEWAEDRPSRDVLEFASALFNRTGQVIADAGGVPTKSACHFFDDISSNSLKKVTGTF